MNAENGAELVSSLPEGVARFFECNVLETESIAAAVSGTVDWIKETGKPLGGVVPAAGVSTPATVGLTLHTRPSPRPYLRLCLALTGRRRVLFLLS